VWSLPFLPFPGLRAPLIADDEALIVLTIALAGSKLLPYVLQPVLSGSSAQVYLR